MKVMNFVAMIGTVIFVVSFLVVLPTIIIKNQLSAEKLYKQQLERAYQQQVWKQEWEAERGERK